MERENDKSDESIKSTSIIANSQNKKETNKETRKDKQEERVRDK